jgi:hypothetical protein
MSENAPMRASDADRDRVATQLRDHFAAGRLDDDELSTRLDSAYAARTIAQLEQVQRDLPALPVAPAVRRAEVTERRTQLRRHLIQQTGGSMTPFVICTAIWFASHGAHDSHGGAPFWPVVTLIFPLLFLLRNGWALYGPAADFERVEAELRHRARGGHSGHGRHRGHHRHAQGDERRRPLGPGDGSTPR